MTSFIIHRLFQNLITFLVILTAIFFLFQAMPGDYASTVLDPKMSPKARQRLREAYGLDQPLISQYWNYMRNMVTLDFGNSFVSGRPVIKIISERIGPTLLLFGSTMVLSFFIGLVMGIILSWNYGRWFEKALTVQGLVFYTAFLPWVALLVLWLFSFQFHIFPLGGMITPEKFASGNLSIWGKTLDILWHLALPLITLTLIRYSGTMLVMRGSMLSEIGSDYARTARAKGLRERKVVVKHVVKNAILPMITSFMLAIPFLVSGSVIVETVFSFPGLGYELINASTAGDFPVVRTIFLFLAIGVLMCNLLADVLYAYIDPRIKYA